MPTSPQRSRTHLASVLSALGAYIKRSESEPVALPGVERVARLLKHLTRFSESVDYNAYHAAGWPLGSGEIESSHRQIPQPRLKIAGACWHPDTINPMLALRVLRANDWWDDDWDDHAQQLREAS